MNEQKVEIIFFFIHIRFNILKSLCEFYLITSSRRWDRNVYITFIFFLMSCTRKFFIRKLYEREASFSSNNFVVWNWFSKLIINIIRTTIVIALHSLNNRFMFVIFVLCNIFFFSFFQFGQKNNTCLTVMCFLSHRQCAIKTLNTRFSCKNLLNSILLVFNWIMSALCIFERLTYMFKWRRLTFEINLRY